MLSNTYITYSSAGKTLNYGSLYYEDANLQLFTFFDLLGMGSFSTFLCALDPSTVSQECIKSKSKQHEYRNFLTQAPSRIS